MAYLEIRRGDELVQRQVVADSQAEKGYSFRLNGEQITIKLGETKQTGPYSLTLKPGLATTGDSVPSPAVLVSETDVAGGGQGPGDVGPDTQRPSISGYEVTGRLGAGGMGSVWLAIQLSTLRKVAIKIMSRSFFGSKKAQNRFAREVELTARLDHPNIAKVYDSGLNEGNYFYVLEYIEGHPLDLCAEANKLSQMQILRLMGRVCKAVHHAHLKGIIHRDLKPSNILVTEDGEPHVLDLGLAKSFLNDDSDVQVSVDGEISGTPAYMSPEQARGDLKQIDMRTDVYSLGTIMFRLLTGHPPHDLSGTRFEVLQRIAKEEVKRPRQIKKDLNSELESLLLKALASDPDARYLSAGDMADDIQNYLTGEPLAARSATTIYFLRKKVRKHLKKVCILAAVILALIGIGLFAFSQVISSRVKVRAAQDELKIQRRSAELAQSEVSSIKGKWQDLEVMVLEGRKETDVRAAVRALHQEYLAAQDEIETLKQEIASFNDPALHWQPQRAVPPPAIEVDGEPFFVICARLCEPNDFLEVARAGYNTVSYTYRRGAQEYLDAAERHNMKAIVYTGGGIRETIDWVKCKTDIEELKDHTALLSWGLPVCPIYHKRSESEIATSYNMVKLTDPEHPAFLLFTPSRNAWPRIPDFATHSDVIAIEPHVYFNLIVNGLGLRDRILGVSYWVDEARILGKDKPLWNHVQACLSPVTYTPKQFRASAYLAVNHGATGIFVCGYKRRLFLEDLPEGARGIVGLGDPQMQDIRLEANRVAGELKQLSPAFLKSHLVNEVTMTNDAGLIDYKAYANPRNNTLYVVAVNTSDQSVSPVFSVPKMMEPEVTALNESREIVHRDGILIDTFAPYDTHVYVLEIDYPKRTIYVNQSATGRNNGRNWQDAHVDLQDALESASRGSQIWVASGTYTPDRGSGDREASFVLQSNVELYGGFNGTEVSLEQRDPNRHLTILSGDLEGDDAEGPDTSQLIGDASRSDNSYHVVMGRSIDQDVILDGFTVTAGNANVGTVDTHTGDEGTCGGGIFLERANVSVQNCIIERNTATGFGGGIWTGPNSNSRFRRCTIQANASSNTGGGMACRKASASVVGSLFKGNLTHSNCGGGISNTETWITFENCEIVNNTTRNGPGGGINFAHKCNSTIRDCLIKENKGTVHGNDSENRFSTYGGGINIQHNCLCVIAGCTIEGNTSNDGGGGIHVWESVLTVTDCNITGNQADARGGGIFNHGSEVVLKGGQCQDNSPDNIGRMN